MYKDSLNSIAVVIEHAVTNLALVTKTPRLEAELLLTKVLHKSRAWLLTWPEHELDINTQRIYQKLWQRRLTGEPIAYIVGEKEFWGMRFKVTQDTLIPRADTECLIEYVLAQDETFIKDKCLNIADLGTGSGAIVLALAKERPNWKFVATDKCQNSLLVAQENAQQHKLHSKIKFFCGDWCQPLGGQEFDLIISNPPYVAKDDCCLTKNGLAFEPQAALVSGIDGSKDLQLIIKQSRSCLKPQGWLILEHGAQQGAVVRDLFKKNKWQCVKTYCDYAKLERFTVAKI